MTVSQHGLVIPRAPGGLILPAYARPEERRATLIAVPAADGLLRFDIHMQGPAETVFFDL